VGQDLVEHEVDGGFGGNVGWHRERIRSDGRGYFRRAGGGYIVDGHARSFGGEAFGDGAAYAMSGAGYDYYPIRKTLRLQAHVLRC
jgi:hypothetical protein